MRRQLPPLNSLKAFETAGRYLNYTRASEELLVTPSAINQQVRILEEFLRVRLIRNTSGKLSLTNEGKEFLPVLREIFDRLDGTTTRIMAERGKSILTVSLLPTFANRWLIPRLKEFQDAHPNIQVRLNTTVRLADLQREEADVAIRFGLGNWPELKSYYLMDEDTFPVCSPKLLEGENKLERPEDLADHTLLIVEKDPRREDWKMWLESVDASDRVDYTVGHRFESSSIALRAASFGLGVAMAHRPFVEDDLKSGILIAPFEHHLKRDGAYHIVTLKGRERTPKVKEFRRWILGCVGLDEEGN